MTTGQASASTQMLEPVTGCLAAIHRGDDSTCAAATLAGFRLRASRAWPRHRLRAVRVDPPHGALPCEIARPLVPAILLRRASRSIARVFFRNRHGHVQATLVADAAPRPDGR